MIGARSAKAGKPRPVNAINKPKHLRIVLHSSDDTLRDRELSPQPWDDFSKSLPALFFGEGLVALPAESHFTLVAHFNEPGSPIDDAQRRLIACLVVVAPRTHAVMTQQNTVGPRVFLNQLFDLQPDVESR